MPEYTEKQDINYHTLPDLWLLSHFRKKSSTGQLTYARTTKSLERRDNAKDINPFQHKCGCSFDLVGAKVRHNQQECLLFMNNKQ
ncbi:run domain beclin-1 interacting and cysteine-rich containing protein-like [Plakobranchus ocellatus]|uniref:Run domain beclin-1 interacting and cysteine-rich containing protein-like n=1 Tax=Plakobranchus ocellatus TaxID=259542 RepID=A0AAV3Z1S4_9GAST|nr:run domain beclin-1 interacting and cysteine-rich containing protein-like [Plakobranchus ocellatus]